MRAHLRGQSSSLPAFGNRRSSTVEYATKRVTSDSRLAGEDGPESLMFGALGRIRNGYGPRSEREGRHCRMLPNLPRFALCMGNSAGSYAFSSRPDWMANKLGVREVQ